MLASQACSSLDQADTPLPPRCLRARCCCCCKRMFMRPSLRLQPAPWRNPLHDAAGPSHRDSHLNTRAPALPPTAPHAPPPVSLRPPRRPPRPRAAAPSAARPRRAATTARRRRRRATCRAWSCWRGSSARARSRTRCGSARAGGADARACVHGARASGPLPRLSLLRARRAGGSRGCPPGRTGAAKASAPVTRSAPRVTRRAPRARRR